MSDGEKTAELTPEEKEWAVKKQTFLEQLASIKANLEKTTKIRGTAPYVMTHLLRQEQEENSQK